MHRLVIVTLMMVGVELPVYIMTAVAYARCIRFLPPLFLAMRAQGDCIAFVSLIQIFCCFFGVKLWGIVHH